MNWRSPGFWVAVFSIAMVLTFVASLSERTSPGPLNSPHDAVPELESGAACSVCHIASDESLAAACTSCHPAVAASIDGGRGVHGALVERDVGDCGFCHVEHQGLDGPTATAIAFQRLGVERVEGFGHEGLGFPLEGAHAELACETCHPAAHAAPLPAGELRFLGLSANCGTCHEDVHKGRMRRDCRDCHSADQPFDAVTDFAHSDERLDAGAHAPLDCSACHVRGSGHEVEFAWHDGDLEQRACSDCHESEHEPEFLAAAGAALGPTSSCGACHSSEPGGFETYSAPDDAWHAWTGFAIDGAHDAISCDACHSTPAGERRLAGLPTDCAACHETPHTGRLARIGGDCAQCHVPTRFDRVAEFDHGRWTDFPLDHAHAATECAACHSTPDGEDRLAGLSTDCAACHATPHTGRLARIGGDCAQCHVPTRFDRVAEFDHGRWTDFPLDHSHAAIDCAACHSTPGGEDRLAGLPTECSACHAPPHEGRLARVGDDCAECHVPTRFDQVAEFDHAHWTGFELRARHASAACEACHPRTERPDALGRSFGRVSRVFGASVERCSDCHLPTHAGLLERAGGERVDCSMCHDEHGFRPTTRAFDHAAWTGVSLDGAHANVSCEACHRPEPDSSRRLGRASARSCVGCHAEVHAGQFVENGVNDCARCHDRTGRTFFDHALHTEFALDGPHADVACGACHATFDLGPLGAVVRYRPMGTDCGDCHAPGGAR